MFSLLLVIQVLVSVSIISLVLLQHGKGADMGAAFGSGAAGTVFGARGSGSFLTRATAILAAIFFINCLLIASPLLREADTAGDSVADQLELQAQQQRQAQETAAPGETAETAPAPEAAAAAAPETAPDVPEAVVGEPAAGTTEPAADDLPPE